MWRSAVFLRLNPRSSRPHGRRLIISLVGILLAGGFGAWLVVRSHSQPAQQPVPTGAIATVNGAPVSESSYGGHLVTINACIQNPTCAAASNFRQLGPKNVALTAAADDLLIEQYGRAMESLSRTPRCNRRCSSRSR